MTEPDRPSLYYASARDKRRARGEKLFTSLGFLSISAASIILAGIIGAIVFLGSGAFVRYEVDLKIYLDEAIVDPNGTRDEIDLRTADYRGLIRESLREMVNDADNGKEIMGLQSLVSPGAEFDLVRKVTAHPDIIGTNVLIRAALSDDADQYLKRGRRDNTGRLDEHQKLWLQLFDEQNVLHKSFNLRFLSGGDSAEPELAGVAAGVIGSFLALIIALAIAVPAGIATAVYLEEFAPKNRIADFVEVTINNLAAVPSIVFGLLGLAILINTMGMPRSAPVVGGIVLALMTLPTVIIASRAAIRSVPSTIYEGALSVGASRMQAVTDHVLPASAPGILTGVIIGLAQALGETAPLLMIGMVAFVVTPPASFTDPSSALPVLIYLWAESPERAFIEKTAGAALVLLLFLVSLNLTAIWLRHKFKVKGI